jgi:hypothetical protein
MRDIQNVTLRPLAGLGGFQSLPDRGWPRLAQNQIYVVPQNQAKTMNANTESSTAPKVINGRIDGRFAKGFSGNPGGSPEATRRAFNKRFLLDLAEDWQQHGREVFKRVRRESPAAYLKVCAMLVPREMKLEHSGGVKAMTDEQLERSIELLQAAIARREAGENAKVIDGVPEPVPALPSPPDGPNKVMDAADTAVGAGEPKPRKRGRARTPRICEVLLRKAKMKRKSHERQHPHESHSAHARGNDHDLRRMR